MRPRDSQRSKMYRAEREAMAPIQKPIPEIPEIRAYLNHIMKSRWFRHRWPLKQTVDLGDGRARSRYAGGWGTRDGVGMALPRFARYDWVILHELAHGLQPPSSAAHGREFAAIYLQLVRQFLGDDAWRALRASFVRHRVRFKKKSARKYNGLPGKFHVNQSVSS